MKNGNAERAERLHLSATLSNPSQGEKVLSGGNSDHALAILEEPEHGADDPRNDGPHETEPQRLQHKCLDGDTKAGGNQRTSRTRPRAGLSIQCYAKSETLGKPARLITRGLASPLASQSAPRQTRRNSKLERRPKLDRDDGPKGVLSCPRGTDPTAISHRPNQLATSPRQQVLSKQQHLTKPAIPGLARAVQSSHHHNSCRGIRTGPACRSKNP